jgi:hypothetical protein
MTGRIFQDFDPTEGFRTLMIGLTGGQCSGKTWSALRLATGICAVRGGIPFVIDTENYSASDYSDYFKFRHVPFDPPFRSEHYLDAVEHCVSQKAGAIIIDSMTHEHSGIGGVLEQFEDFMRERCGDDWAKRKRISPTGWQVAKEGRQRLYKRLAYVCKDTPVIMCFRAKDAGSYLDGEDKGQKADSTNPILYDLKINFLLTSGGEGVAALQSDKQAERDLIKRRRQFADWFDGKPVQLDEALGERFGKWMLGPNAETPKAPETAPTVEPPTDPPFDPVDPNMTHEVIIGEYAAELDNCKSRAKFKEICAAAGAYVKKHGLVGSEVLGVLTTAKLSASERLEG